MKNLDGNSVKKLLIAGFAAAAFCGAPALAADIGVKAPLPAPTPVYSWTGFYFGADVGGVWTNNTGMYDPLPSPAAFNNNVISASNGGSSVTGGFHAGYNYQFSPIWVAGIEGDWSWAHASGSFNQVATFFTGGPISGSSVSMSSTMDWMSSLRARLGYVVAPNLLTYATGGVAWGHFDYAANNKQGLASPGYVATAALSSTQVGYVVGGGLEWAMTNNWILRAEYLFYNFGGAPNVAVQQAGTPGFPSGYSWSSTNVSVARAGLSYKF
jgi:outer membrane immunogenic protein